ncbi:hypothetical protein BLNAU_5621 [Blattamonas nauphoetae]|uniref:Uncharacterized protein n=1 Tax=Blattamonas nauphoetae TaxID=2049346 RepID=A0ABQ9Y6C6_9EUKA|nr:hypothetical protein BLNAU_5621 [Blattamonas nauphoetae]
MSCSRHSSLRRQPQLFCHFNHHLNNELASYWLSLRPVVLPIVCRIHPLLKSHLHAKEETSHITARLTIVTIIQCICETETISEGNSSSDIISTPKSISTPSFPQFNATTSSSSLKEEPLIQRKKLTPTSTSFGPRLELKDNQKTETHLTSFQAPLSQMFLLSRDFFHTFKQSNVATIFSEDSAFRRFTIESLLPISSTFSFLSIPIELLSCGPLPFISHSALAKAECLLRTDVLAQLFDISQSVNPELVLCGTGSFPASLSLSMTDIAVVFKSDVPGSPTSTLHTSYHVRRAVLYRHKDRSECKLALAIEEKIFSEERKKHSVQDDERHSLIKRLLSAMLTQSIQKQLSLSRPIVTSHSVVEYPRLLIDASRSEHASTRPALAGSEPNNDNPDSIAFSDDTSFTQRGCPHYSRCGCSLMQTHRWWRRRLMHTTAPHSSRTRIPIIQLVQPNSSLEASTLKADISCGALASSTLTHCTNPQAKLLNFPLKALILHKQQKRNIHPKTVSPLSTCTKKSRKEKPPMSPAAAPSPSVRMRRISIFEKNPPIA